MAKTWQDYTTGKMVPNFSDWGGKSCATCKHCTDFGADEVSLHCVKAESLAKAAGCASPFCLVSMGDICDWWE